MRSAVILLACGCFNPITNMHLRMFEIAKDYLHRMGQYEVIGGIVSPVHDAYGKKDLVAASHRINMLKLSLEGNEWIKLSDWESRLEGWTRTRQTLQYHQNHLNAYLHSGNNIDINEDELKWMPDNIKRRCEKTQRVIVKLLCGADLLESFGTPGLWADEDIESIVGEHGLVVITRSNINPREFIYNSDMLTKYMANISIVIEWISNEISSTKVRRALKRSESVKYLISDKVIDYIHSHFLYGSCRNKYLNTEDSSSGSINNTCVFISNNNNLMNNSNNSSTIQHYEQLTSVDSFKRSSRHHGSGRPGQAVKIIPQKDRIDLPNNNTNNNNEVCIKSSKNSSAKSCDENFIKFIFTKHGIQVISDVETIV